MGKAGHLEDIVVRKSHQGHKLGYKLVNVLKQIAVLNSCYKITLDCAKDVIGFYEKNDFFVKGV
eukprot:CAMPEP_0116879872 /NCGR_PEP_ID=MMETSP0463-20121206/11720_1 /TAXON_ID=181622 /ORGANISM="Strombidinopsis sp, Strain SopsisLIS2011" /LENGTH=63 /DNA_ID=CAMNT_0004529723 /DNA_START=248 /DNA_END=439 /DNA_ORIENTATION=-